MHWGRDVRKWVTVSIALLYLVQGSSVQTKMLLLFEERQVCGNVCTCVCKREKIGSGAKGDLPDGIANPADLNAAGNNCVWVKETVRECVVKTTHSLTVSFEGRRGPLDRPHGHDLHHMHIHTIMCESAHFRLQSDVAHLVSAISKIVLLHLLF